MDKKQCNIIRDMLPLYIDDVVCPDTRQWVEAHLRECSDCCSILEGMRKTAAIPAETDISALERFKRHISRGRLIAAVAGALAVLAVLACVVYWLCWVEVIEYDGSNIEVYEVESGYGLMARYNGPGNVGYGFSTNVETGISSLVITQVRWKKYIEPLFWDMPAEFYLTGTDQTLRVQMQTTGETLWEADEAQTRRYHERQKAENNE